MPGRHAPLPVTLLGAVVLATMPGGGQAQDAPSFAPGAGVDMVRSRCSACHAATMITTRRLSARQWGAVVDQMIAKGAQVSDADYDVIVAYLAQTYGADR